MRALIALARPRMLPYLLLLPLGGWGFAHWDRALTPRGGAALLWVLASWTLLHAGTLWLNAAVDRDEGEVLWGRAARVPRSAAAWGYAALAGCVLAALPAGPTALACAALGAVLAVAYSHPRLLLKAHPVGGPAVNGLGYGLLSPIAGWSVAETSATARGVAVLGLGLCGVLAAYFAAQAFQADEDRARGYRTLVATAGPAAAIAATRACVWLGFLGTCALALAGWVPRGVLLAVPLVLWVDAHLRAWARQPGGGDASWAKGLALRLLGAGLVALALLLGAYAGDIRAGRPVAGLATAAGHPPDRPLLPPRALRAWELRRAENDRPRSSPAEQAGSAPR